MRSSERHSMIEECRMTLRFWWLEEKNEMILCSEAMTADEKETVLESELSKRESQSSSMITMAMPL
jgi:hypothetical protein